MEVKKHTELEHSCSMFTEVPHTILTQIIPRCRDLFIKPYKLRTRKTVSPFTDPANPCAQQERTSCGYHLIRRSIPGDIGIRPLVWPAPALILHNRCYLCYLFSICWKNLPLPTSLMSRVLLSPSGSGSGTSFFFYVELF